MAALLIVLLLAIVLAGAGFALHLLWWIAVVIGVLWLVGFFFHGADSGGSARWYRW
jgi:hypothetical protein